PIYNNLAQVASEQSYAREYPLPTLYAVERVGMASGLKYLGETDWYQKGADYLLKRQGDDGSWKGDGNYYGALAATCFGILFLARGRAPVMMTKLRHGDVGIGESAPAPDAAPPRALE